MNNWLDFLSIFSLTQMLMAILVIAPHWKKAQSLRLFVILMVCAALHVCGSFSVGSTVSSSTFQLIIQAGSNALPGVFWLVSLSIFGEHMTIKRWHGGVASMTLLIPLSAVIIETIFNINISEYDAIANFIKYGAMALELTLVGHALIIVGKYWDSDLIQRRRYMRGGVIGAAALYIFLIIVIKQLLQVSWSGLALLEVLSLAMLITTINLFLFQLSPNSIFVPSPLKIREIEPDNVASQELSAILNAMENDLMYQQEGLTITVFAKALGIHEYKLRTLINGELSFRNFNDFLNHYRIAEVTKKLEENHAKPLPVLTLALESGFRSLSSFNKAFKDKHGVTPTEYRKRVNS